MNDTDTRLVQREIPIFLYLIGLFLTAIGVYGSLEGLHPILLILIAAGLAILLFTNALTITADRMTRTLTLRYRSLMRRSQKEYSFDEITGISVQTVPSGKNTTYRIVLRGRDGNLIPLRMVSSSGWAGKRRLAEKLQKFTGLPDFDCSQAGMTYAALQSLIDNVQETDGVRWQIQPIGAARWHSPDFKFPGAFLCLAQKAHGQASGGVLASFGGMLYKQMLARQFRSAETPGLDQAVTVTPLDAALEQDFMAFTNAPEQTARLINSTVVRLLSDWAGRYRIEQFRAQPAFGPITVLFGPDGVYVAPTNPLQPSQVQEVAALGVALVKSQKNGFA